MSILLKLFLYFTLISVVLNWTFKAAISRVKRKREKYLKNIKKCFTDFNKTRQKGRTATSMKINEHEAFNFMAFKKVDWFLRVQWVWEPISQQFDLRLKFYANFSHCFNFFLKGLKTSKRNEQTQRIFFEYSFIIVKCCLFKSHNFSLTCLIETWLKIFLIEFNWWISAFPTEFLSRWLIQFFLTLSASIRFDQLNKGRTQLNIQL